MKTPLVIDVETTIKNKGNVYTKDNKLCYVGLYDGELTDIFRHPIFNIGLDKRLLIGFNLKFDLAWLQRYGIDYSSCTIWDCQLAHFILSGQSEAYPSLNSTCEYYNLGRKLDIVSMEYWNKGIDTPNIPVDVITKYLEQDLKLTWQVYEKQREEFEKNPQLFKLFQLQCEDLLTLLDMEWNGIDVDVTTCKVEAEKCQEQIKQIDMELAEYIGDTPFNWNSGDHISCLLYGGTIVHETRVAVGVYKTGAKVGQPRHKVCKYEFKLPGLCKPPKGSALAKEGYYSTDEDTLRTIGGGKRVKRLTELLLTRSKIEKLRGTYYVGIPATMQEIDSFDGRLHGQFNQCVARTGRLSSSKPNLQNFPPEMKRLLVSRYDNSRGC